MKRFIFLLLIPVLLFSCNEDDSSSPTPIGDEIQFLENIIHFSQLERRLFEIGTAENATPIDALKLLAEELNTDPSVESTSFIEDTYFHITYTSGYEMRYFIDLQTDEGLSQFRGGQNGLASLMLFGGPNGNDELNIIENTEVLLFAPVVIDFYEWGEFEQLKAQIEAANQDVTVTVVQERDCKPEVLSTFDQYGFVMITSHGEPDGFLLGEEVSFGASYNDDLTPEEAKQRIIETIGQNSYDKLLNGQLRFTGRVKYTPGSPVDEWLQQLTEARNFKLAVTSSGAQQLLPDLSNTVVFGNYCYSGWSSTETYINQGHNLERRIENPLMPKFMAKNPISFYGYGAGSTNFSYVVDNFFAKKMENNLINELFGEKDCTGEAHLENNESIYQDTYYVPSIHVYGRCQFNQYGRDDYQYEEECFGSFIDPRDQTEYETVCIGDQVWMAENLRYDTAGSYVPAGLSEEAHGRFYTFEATTGNQNAQDGQYLRGVCPEGWHVPARVDWVKLFNTLGYDASGDYFFQTATENPDNHNDQPKAVIQLLTNNPDWAGYQFFNQYDDSEINSSELGLQPDGAGIFNDGQFSHDFYGAVRYYSSSPLRKNGGSYDYSIGDYFDFGYNGGNLAQITSFTIADPDSNSGALPCRCVKD